MVQYNGHGTTSVAAGHCVSLN